MKFKFLLFTQPRDTSGEFVPLQPIINSMKKKLKVDGL